jgi:hypothetical protein
MTREQLAHVLRTVSQLTGDHDVLVTGSQSILGSYSEDELPPEATGSMEVDTAFFSDPDDAKSDLVDVNIGELSEFHDEFGYYPQGVSVSTGVSFETPGTRPGRGLCLEPHDCILAQLVRFDEKDQNFAYVLVRARLIDLDILQRRTGDLPAHPAVIQRIQTWIQAMRAGNNPGK